MEEMETEISYLRTQQEKTRKEMLAERDKQGAVAENLRREIAALQSELQAVGRRHSNCIVVTEGNLSTRRKGVPKRD